MLSSSHKIEYLEVIFIAHTSWYLLDLFFFFFFFSSLFLRASPVSHGGSQARGRIGGVAAGLCHSNARYEPHLRPQLTATLNP